MADPRWPCLFVLGGVACGFVLGLFIVPNSDTGTNKLYVNINRIHKNDSLYSAVRILCWVVTGPSNHKTKAIHVMQTWGRRCNKLLFMSSVSDDSIPAIALPVKEGRENLWAKTKAAAKYLYTYHIEDADWFFKADDDTYAILNNMRLLLHTLDPLKPHYLGCEFHPAKYPGYMSGGAGYILSKTALQLLVETGLPNDTLCKPGNDGDEDVELGRCLGNLGIEGNDTRDEFGALRFHPYMAEVHMDLFEMKTPKKTWFENFVTSPVQPVRLFALDR